MDQPSHSEGRLPEHPHRGITMHQIPVGGNFPGLLFAVGSALIFLLAIPALWYVVAAAVVGGIVLALLLQFFHRAWPEEISLLTLKLRKK